MARRCTLALALVLAAGPASAAGTPVGEENFIVAETDRYFSEHVPDDKAGPCRPVT